MNDQAARLRRKVETLKNPREAKTICILSGKGGVGKSNIAVNFALELKNQNENTLIIDLDIGMGNIDILLGTTSKKSIYDLFHESESIFHIIEKGNNGLDNISGGSALNEFLLLDEKNKLYFMEQYRDLASAYDYIIFDMGAGINPDSLFFILAADELIVITTLEPTSITDAYSVIKQLVHQQAKMPIRVIMNRCPTQKAGEHALDRFKEVIKQFLQVDIIGMGVLPEDRAVGQAVMKQIPYIFNEKSHITKELKQITYNYLHSKKTHTIKPTFIQKLKQYLMER